MLRNTERLNDITVSYAPEIKISDVELTSLHEVVRKMQSDSDLEQHVNTIRATTDPVAKQELKKKLPYFSFCSFDSKLRKNVYFLSTHCFIFDADHVLDLPLLREKVEADNEILLAFTSPSGDGLKFAVQLAEKITDAKIYKDSYKKLKVVFERRYDVKLDDSTIDPARATFLSFDPDIHVNGESSLVHVPAVEVSVPSIEESACTSAPAKQLKAIVKKTKVVTALQGTTPGNRHGDLTSIVGHLITKGIEEDITIELMCGWNKLNSPPKGDQEIVDTVKDLYKRYLKQKTQSFGGLCKNYWSLASDVLEFGVTGGDFYMSKIGKEKYLGFVGAKEKEEKEAAFQYLLDNKHISNIRLVKHISDVTASETSYNVNLDAGEVTVRYVPIEVRVQDNKFIEEYLLSVFGQYTSFIKEYMAAYCYSNFKDLPTLVLKGDRGCGKNTFAEVMYAIFPALSQTWEAKQGSFTPEAEKKLLIADETVTESVEVYKLIKKIGGSKYAQVNKKYQIPYDVENNMNIIIMSNAEIPIYVAKEEKPSSESNNQFFVYKFKPFTGTIDPDLDQKLEDRIGHYVRTELKEVFDGLDFAGNRYSIKTPITPEEAGLFESNITEEQSAVEKVIDAIVDAPSQEGFNPLHGQLMAEGWIPGKLITEKAPFGRMTDRELIRHLREQGYIEMKESSKQSAPDSKQRFRCFEMTEKFKQALKS
jgi:hypothetical protein